MNPIQLVQNLMKRLAGLNWPLELYIAARYIFANIRQSLIIMLAVGMGVSIIIFIPSVNLSFFEYFIRKTVHSSPHVMVTKELETRVRNQQLMKAAFDPKQTILMSDQSLTRRRKMKAYNDLMLRLKEIPGVEEVAPYVKEQAIVVRGSQTRAVDLSGIVPELEKRVSDIGSNIIEGNLDTVSSDEVFIGTALADELGVQVGNRIQIVTPWKRKSFKVAGLINNGNYFKDLSQVVTTLEGAQQVLNLPNEVTGIGLTVLDIYDAKKVAEVIRTTYPVKARSWIEDNVTMLEQIQNFRMIIAFVSFMIVMAAASSITSVLIMVISAKSKEIGILKAMGTTPGMIMRIFLIQAIFLSVLGAICGLGGGAFFIALYNLSPMSRADTFLGIAREPVVMNFEYTVYAFCYAIGSSIIASLFPAWRAGKLDPVEAINN